MAAEFETFFLASSGASAALIGLLFVAVSIAPEKVFGSDAEAVRQAQALSAFTALANAFFISMASLIPDVRIGIVVTIVAFASAMQTLALLTLVKHWLAQSIVYRGVVLFLGSALIYALELAVGIQLWGCARQQGVAVWAAGADPRGLCDRPGSRVGAARREAASSRRWPASYERGPARNRRSLSRYTASAGCA